MKEIYRIIWINIRFEQELSSAISIPVNIKAEVEFKDGHIYLSLEENFRYSRSSAQKIGENILSYCITNHNCTCPYDNHSRTYLDFTLDRDIKNPKL